MGRLEYQMTTFYYEDKKNFLRVFQNISFGIVR